MKTIPSSTSISQHENHANSFDALRLFAAYAVLFAHHFDLTNNVGPTLFGIGFGGLGVAIFFAISGYLITGSYINDPNFGRFMMRRILRIFPGLAVCVFLTVFVFGVLLTTLDVKEYLTDSRTWIYLKTLVLNIKQELPGLFEKNPYPKAVNGSLWTIPIEFKCYLLLGVICWISRVDRVRFLIFSAFVSALYYFFREVYAQNESTFYALFPLAFFVAVSYRAASAAKYGLKWLNLGLLTVALLVALLFPTANPMAIMMLAAIAVIWLGTKSLLKLPEFFIRNDISYGLYLYAFLVQQIVYSTGLHEDYFWLTLVLVTVLTTLCALLSCKLVEQPALKLKPKRGLIRE